jgi:hypothetical protein
MFDIPRNLYGLVLLGGCLLATACEPIRVEDRNYFENREKQRAARESLMRSATGRTTNEDLIRFVREAPADIDGSTGEQWLNRQLESYRGQIMFPHWSVGRRGSNKQDVSFSFVHIDEKNNTRRLTYFWEVDALTMTIGAPRLEARDEAASPDRSLADQVERRIRAHELELE